MKDREPPQGFVRVALGATCGLLVSGLGILICYLLQIGADYGIWLFLGLPVLFGLASSIAIEWSAPAHFVVHAGSILTGQLIICFLSIFMVKEGLICWLMAFPLVFGIALIGSAIGMALCNAFRGRPGPISLSLAVALPFFIVYDSATAGKPDVRSMSTSVEIDAPPSKIWPNLTKLDNVPDGGSWMFQSGVAHPVQIRTMDAEVGGRRECVLTTGIMAERITEWIPQKRLSFAVLNTPPSMQEVNPFGEVDAPHLEGYFECLEGSFVLIALPNGRTRLVGTSFYQHKFRPSTYWGWWTDLIVRQVHLSVLNEVKRLAER